MTGHSRSGGKKKKEKKKSNLLLPNGLILCEAGSSLSKGDRGIQRHSAPCSRSLWCPRTGLIAPQPAVLTVPSTATLGGLWCLSRAFLKSTTPGLLLPLTLGCRGSPLPPSSWPWPSPRSLCCSWCFLGRTPSLGPHTEPMPTHINYIWVSHRNTRLQQPSPSTCL